MLAAGAGAPAIGARQRPHDLVIRGGTVFDGTGAAGRELDVAISAGRLADMGARLTARGREEIDAREQAVVPGFVDIHSHGDRSLRDDPRGESVIRQGITTIVAGADGGSQATGAEEASFAALWRAIDALRPGPNVASMVGLGSVRGAVLGSVDRAPSPAELARMTAMVRRALADGACGASTGLEYAPGAFARPDELAALCRPLVRHGLPYATHMRNEDDRLLDALDEAVAVAKAAGCALQVSHLKTMGQRNWAKLDTALARVEAARAAGLDVMFDRYPYIAYATGLTNLFPVWSLEGGVQAFLARATDPTHGARIRREVLENVTLIGGWDHVQITAVRAEADRAAEGQRLGAYAAAVGRDPYDLSFDLLRRSDGDVGMVGFAMSEANLERLLAHPCGLVCSDGSAFAVDGPTRRGTPHPRGAGSFPRVLGRYVRERRVLSLAEAIRKMTSLPAARVHLADRGVLSVGRAADVVVFDPARVADTATFDAPFQYPKGVSCVVVNGVVALRDGHRNARGSGRALRAG